MAINMCVLTMTSEDKVQSRLKLLCEMVFFAYEGKETLLSSIRMGYCKHCFCESI